MTIEVALKSRYPIEICDVLLESFREIEESYSLQKWKVTELDAGHFVEAARRLIEQELFGGYTPLGESLPKFNDGELKRYENATGHDSLRILIPRVLKAVYNIRNKRGVGHLGTISANEMDSTLIFYCVKWVFAELVRMAAGTDPGVTQKMVDSIVERRIPLLWKHQGITRILANQMDARAQILVLLLDSSPQTEMDLQTSIDYKNKSNFRKILKRLHQSRLIDWTHGGQAFITPKGRAAAETLVLKHRL
jgi:hypothetical protein